MMRPATDRAADRSGAVDVASRRGYCRAVGRPSVLALFPHFVALTFALLAIAAHARADSLGDEPAVTGRTGAVDSTVVPDAAARSGTGSEKSSSQSSDEADAATAVEPRRIFEFAVSEMAAGRLLSAQRQLELFVAGHPDHPDAGAARRHLARLYQDGVAPAVAGAPSSVAPIDVPRAARDLGINPALGALPPRRVVLDRTAPAALEDSFAEEAGDRVFFNSGSAELGQRARAVLQAQARWLKRNPALFAVVEGHADDEGLGAYDMVRLSQARAEAVYRRLVEEGVPRQRLATSAWGRDMPVANCDSALCAAQNRRSVTVLTFQRVSELPALELGTGRAAAH